MGKQNFEETKNFFSITRMREKEERREKTVVLGDMSGEH